MSLTVVILTFNESLHIARAIESIRDIADHILVVDSGSTDETVAIARSYGAEVVENEFITQAKQFNWSLDQLPDNTDWVFRLDADEVVSSELAHSLATSLDNLPSDIAGARVLRRMAFLRHPIRWGGVFPVQIIRVFRYGRGRSEDRWMDEHITLDGDEVTLRGEILDDSLQPLGWWIEKHNAYAAREVVEILDAEFRFLGRERTSRPGGPAGAKRWVKEKIYMNLPGGLRPLLYFTYRYFFRLGFLDGAMGSSFHILHGFWYRYLVDVKLKEVRKTMERSEVDVVEAIDRVLGIDVRK